MKFQLAIGAVLVACAAATLTAGSTVSTASPLQHTYFYWTIIADAFTTGSGASGHATSSNPGSTTEAPPPASTTQAASSTHSATGATGATMLSAARRRTILLELARRAEVANPAPTDACAHPLPVFAAAYYAGQCYALSNFYGTLPGGLDITVYATFSTNNATALQTLTIFSDAACLNEVFATAPFPAGQCETIQLPAAFNNFEIAFKTSTTAPGTTGSTGSAVSSLGGTTQAVSLTSAGSLVGPSSLLFAIAAILISRLF